MESKKQKDLLELAWRTAFDSATYKVTGDQSHTLDVISDATEYLKNIDRSEWFPVAREILDNDSFIGDHELAEKAARVFLNRKMETTGLKVSLGGDW